MCEKKAPFGSTTTRFNSMGQHPDLDPVKLPGVNIDAGLYQPKAVKCLRKEEGHGWARKLLLEQFSKRRNPEKENFLKTLCGPGSYDIPEFAYGKKCDWSKGRSVFGGQKRFFQFKDDKPGPGTYEPDIFKRSSVIKTQFTPVPPFEWERERFKSPRRAWCLPPNTYDPKRANLADRVASKKGPGKFSTAPRDASTIRNHFAPPIDRSLDKFYDHVPEIDYLLHHKNREKHGKLNPERQEKQEQPWMISELSQKSVAIDKRAPEYKPPKKNKYPFNLGAIETRPGTKWNNQPGPGRYHIRYRHCHKRPKRNSWVFLSKTGRSFYKIQSYAIFD